jgi:hypothetical protein
MVKFADHLEFCPDFTPKQMFELGIFGGSYFRPIYSTVIKKKIEGDYSKYKFLKNVPLNKLTNKLQNLDINKYKKKASLSLNYWEDHHWIHPTQPRGWVGWYCAFYSGIRSVDDDRQIKRALKMLVRFGQRSPSPTIKQSLLHWAWNGEKDHTNYINKIKKDT